MICRVAPLQRDRGRSRRRVAVAWRSERFKDLAIASATLVILGAGILVYLGGAMAIGPLACVGYSLDSDEWAKADDNRVDDARRLAACSALSGMDRATVKELLREPGTRDHGNREWGYPVGETGKFIGPGDSAVLTVRFDESGRVVSVDGP